MALVQSARASYPLLLIQGVPISKPEMQLAKGFWPEGPANNHCWQQYPCGTATAKGGQPRAQKPGNSTPYINYSSDAVRPGTELCMATGSH